MVTIRRLVIVLAILVAGYQFGVHGKLFPPPPGTAAAPGETASPAPGAASNSSSGSAIAEAYEHQRSNVQVEGSGRVERLLKDDNDSSRHQRFIVRLDSGQTVLIAHNIDLAPRVDSLREGDDISFAGEYEWNDKGGVVHWTHHDPGGRHVAGWLRHDGRTYQ